MRVSQPKQLRQILQQWDNIDTQNEFLKNWINAAHLPWVAKKGKRGFRMAPLPAPSVIKLKLQFRTEEKHLVMHGKPIEKSAIQLCYTKNSWHSWGFFKICHVEFRLPNAVNSAAAERKVLRVSNVNFSFDMNEVGSIWKLLSRHLRFLKNPLKYFLRLFPPNSFAPLLMVYRQLAALIKRLSYKDM